MKKVLILFAHPKFEESKTNKELVKSIPLMKDVTFHDLYERYPDFHIDIEHEKKLLLSHDVIVWHHPFYWYSCPPLMKQWIDTVLEYGWAYGPNGNALHTKQCMHVVTTGGSKEVYCSEGTNLYSINEFLRPFEQTARLCGMDYLAPFAVMGTHRLTQSDLLDYADQYQSIIQYLQRGKPISEVKNCVFQNDIPQSNNLELI